jgi:hypothetical protein
MPTERAITGLRQHMVSACREILHYEIGEKPQKRKKVFRKCIEDGYGRFETKARPEGRGETQSIFSTRC